MNPFRELLLAEPCVPALSDEQIGALEDHFDLLMRWNRRLNLTAIRSAEDAVRLHYAESLFLAKQLERLPQWVGVQRICDVGSGGGFPGVGIAVLHPDRSVELVESHRRKSVFLRESTQGLRNISVTSQRFDELNGPWDLVVSRAVAWKGIAKHARKVAECAGLLVGPSDTQSILQIGGFDWQPPILVPYDRGCVLLGCVPRGTDRSGTIP
jgi:16S rRNA (guanine(527)-N(7))-methyltransferase RsmG